MSLSCVTSSLPDWTVFYSAATSHAKQGAVALKQVSVQASCWPTVMQVAEKVGSQQIARPWSKYSEGGPSFRDLARLQNFSSHLSDIYSMQQYCTQLQSFQLPLQ